MKRLVDEVTVYKIRDNKILKVKTINVSVKEHGYYKTHAAAKKQLLREIDSDIKLHQKWENEEMKSMLKERKQKEEYIKLRKSVVNG